MAARQMKLVPVRHDKHGISRIKQRIAAAEAMDISQLFPLPQESCCCATSSNRAINGHCVERERPVSREKQNPTKQIPTNCHGQMKSIISLSLPLSSLLSLSSSFSRLGIWLRETVLAVSSSRVSPLILHDQAEFNLVINHHEFFSFRFRRRHSFIHLFIYSFIHVVN